MKPTRDELETSILFTAADRQRCVVYSNDPWFQRKLERVGATVTKEIEGGGKEYEMHAKQVSLRKRRDKSAMSEEQRVKTNAHMEAMRSRRDAVDAQRSAQILSERKNHSD